MSDRALYAEDVAKIRRISIRQAQRWLAEMEMTHGPAVVGQIKGRSGVRRYTTESAMAVFGPYRPSFEARVDAMLEAFGKRLADLEERFSLFSAGKRRKAT
jgi:hypothetical protein